ncbi:hypothetical protein ABIA32_002713 [Streptacidiphilus sp. MAP12-20]|uniref:hypothetical protein n=1 Tax=Streptacidiphilus sp. MAP12-20 TaxID=3156299 RepID=UPI0035141ADD
MNWLRRLSARVYDGSVVIGWRVARWPWATAEGGSRLGRLIVLAVIGSLSWRVPWLFCACWAFAAWRAAPLEPERAPEPTPTPQSPDELYLRLILGHIGDETGIHLADLLPAIQQAEEGLEHMTRDDLRDLLAALRVPVRAQLRVGVRTGVAGVHRDDAAQALVAYLARAPSPEA